MPASRHCTRNQPLIETPTSPQTSPSASLYPYISKLPCQAQWTPYKAVQPPHRRSEKPGTICNANMISASIRCKAPGKPCKPFFLKDDTYIPEPSKPRTSPLRPISVNKGTTKPMTPCKPWQERDEPYVRWHLLEPGHLRTLNQDKDENQNEHEQGRKDMSKVT